MLKKKVKKLDTIQKKILPLHRFLKGAQLKMILARGVTVALQILVLYVKVRILTGQLSKKKRCRFFPKEKPTTFFF
jgi:hypothetical protein